VIANPMSGSVAAAPSHNLERIVVPPIRSPVHRPWRNSAGPEPPDVNEAMPRERPHLYLKDHDSGWLRIRWQVVIWSLFVNYSVKVWTLLATEDPALVSAAARNVCP
jgi:hypothetical protein